MDAIKASRDDIPDRLIVTDGEGREVGSISLRDILPR
jgi:predicted transcriptional regulator